jgi:long-subunit acyl-CoA synthetase (AMP-forming)
MFTAVPRLREDSRPIHEEVTHAGGLKHTISRAAAAEAERPWRADGGCAGTCSTSWFTPRSGAAFGGRVRFDLRRAPLPVFIGEFFHGAGVLSSRYGLTETSPVISVNLGAGTGWELSAR